AADTVTGAEAARRSLVEELPAAEQALPARRRPGRGARQDPRQARDELQAQLLAVQARGAAQPHARRRPRRHRLREALTAHARPRAWWNRPSSVIMRSRAPFEREA